MASVEFVDEGVLVEARSLNADQIQPLAVTWRGRRYILAGTGRQWDEEMPDQKWRYYLAQTNEQDTFELRLDLIGGQWRLMRVWTGRRLV